MIRFGAPSLKNGGMCVHLFSIFVLNDDQDDFFCMMKLFCFEWWKSFCFNDEDENIFFFWKIFFWMMKMKIWTKGRHSVFLYFNKLGMCVL